MEKTVQLGKQRLMLPFLSMGMATLLPTFGMSIANVALPTFGTIFDASLQEVQWIVSGYLAALALFSLVAGRFVDRWGNRVVLGCGYITFALGAILCMQATDLSMLLWGRLVQGTGAAALAVVAIALAKDIGGKTQIGRAMGALATLTAVGTALGPAVGGIILDWFGWQSLFVVLLGVAGFGVLTMFWIGAKDIGAKDKVSDAKLDREKPARIWSRFYGAAISNAFVSVIMMTTFIAGPFFLKFVLGYSDAQVGLVMAVGPVISILSGVPAGYLVDRFGDRMVMIFGLSSLILGALSFSYLPIWTGVVGYIVALIVLTPGYQMFLAANNSNVMRQVETQGKGAASGLLNVSRNAGLIIGASAIAWVFSFGAGASDIAAASSAQIGAGFQLVFWLNAVLISAVLISVFIRR